MKLYSYWRSSTSYRVRIGLNLKAMDYAIQPINLVNGEQREAGFAAINPIMGVPALELGEGQILTQSMAILSYLDQVIPAPAFLPDDPMMAANVRAAAMVIACDIHPINNLRIVGRLKSHGFDADQCRDWMNHWMREGLRAYQSLIDRCGAYSFGDTVSLADICLVPQLYNAHRWNLDLTEFHRLTEIEENCLALPAFDAARPEKQPDSLP
ncbi:MAG: maleylacetoacetate isomerase [Proteobacteria bacterium]|nr:maleylacetoacetate isomerase [Pseudomonadota bacterium]